MAYFFSRRKLRPTAHEESDDLNIVPYLDILMNLIMFMLLSITGLASFGALNVSAPNYGGDTAQAALNDADKPKLLLSVLISKKGFFVAGAGAVLRQKSSPGAPQGAADGLPTVPKDGAGKYDYGSLTAQMVEIKKAFPTETRVIVGAEADIAYETLVETMDAIRETPGRDRHALFSDVTLAAM